MGAPHGGRRSGSRRCRAGGRRRRRVEARRCAGQQRDEGEGRSRHRGRWSEQTPRPAPRRRLMPARWRATPPRRAEIRISRPTHCTHPSCSCWDPMLIDPPPPPPPPSPTWLHAVANGTARRGISGGTSIHRALLTPHAAARLARRLPPPPPRASRAGPRPALAAAAPHGSRRRKTSSPPMRRACS